MDWAKLANLSVGLAAFLGGMWILLKIILALRGVKNNHPHAEKTAEKSAGLTAGEWKAEMRAAVKDMLSDTAPKRHEDLRKLIEEILERVLARRSQELRSMMKEVIGEWADIRFGKDKGQDR